MDLTPEERRRIYEEEKAKLEAEEKMRLEAERIAKLAQTSGPPVERHVEAVKELASSIAAETERHKEEEAKQRQRAEASKRNQGTLLALLVVLGTIYLVAYVQLSPSPPPRVTQASASSGPTLRPTPTPKPTPTPDPAEEALRDAMHEASQNDYLGAVGFLEGIPKSSKLFGKAKVMIAEYRAKADVQEASEARAERQKQAANDAQDKIDHPEHWIRVQEGVRWETGDDSDYDHIRGSIKNESPRAVRYWKITFDFYDASNHIIDSAYTNSADLLLPGAARRFDVIHRHPEGGKTFNSTVSDVRFE